MSAVKTAKRIALPQEEAAIQLNQDAAKTLAKDAALANVPVDIHVRLGQCRLTVGELNQLATNSVLKLDTLANTPVDIMLEQQVIAKGELVVVDDCFAVHIVDVL